MRLFIGRVYLPYPRVTAREVDAFLLGFGLAVLVAAAPALIECVKTWRLL